MPRPKEGESKKDYVARFMASPEAQSDFPDEKQRMAVAYSMFEKRNATGEYGWPKLYSCTFIEPGVVFYQDLGDSGETVLVQKPALDKMLKSFVGKPVINFVHKDVTPSTVADGEADGVVSRVWFDEASGWYKCEFIVWDAITQLNCESAVYSVSCAYEPTEVNSDGGSYHNLPYQEEVLNGEYTHLAIVANPRYEGARIFVNSVKGGSKMGWKFWAAKATKKNAADLDPVKSMVDVDGDKVTLQQLYDAVKPGETTLEMSDDTVFEVDGKEHTLGSLKDAHRNKLKSAKDAEEKAKAEKANGESEEELRRGGMAKNDQAEEAAKKSASEADAKRALELQQADDEAKKKKDEEEKKNADDAAAKKAEEEKRNAGKRSFADLKNSARLRQGDPVAITLVTSEERLLAGQKKYGSAAKQ